MLFTDTIKFYILGLSVSLLLLALGILAWQAYGYCTHAAYTPQDTVANTYLLYSDQNSRTTVNTSGPPRTQQAECSTEVCRQSCCLSEVLVPSSESNHADNHMLEQASVKKDLVGEVLLSLRFRPTSQRLEVGLLKVRMVVTEIYSDAVKISVQYNQCKLRYQKTSAVVQRLVTIFNEVLVFHLPEFPLQECKILVSVYNTQMAKKSTKHPVGHLTVGKEKNSEDKHWSLMMHSVHQPVAKWHRLLF